MSGTTSITLAPSADSARVSASSSPPPLLPLSCATCGSLVPHHVSKTLQDAQDRISDLESQVKILTLRATSAVEKANEYEASLRALTLAARSPTPSATHDSVAPHPAFPADPAVSSPAARSAASTPASAPTPNAATATAAAAAPIRSQLARLLTRSASAASAAPSTAPLHRPAKLGPLPTAGPQPVYPATAGLAQSEMSLLDALTQEQALRRAAETAAAQTNSEIEELTGQLFEQANEMVATERKARARLEERVELLERRDGEKAKRLGVLERRVLRVERVRHLLEKEKELEAHKAKYGIAIDPDGPG